MARLRDLLLKPIAETPARAWRLLQRHPAEAPDAEATPLRVHVNKYITDKQAHCSHHCTGCKYSAAGGCALDSEFIEGVAETSDAESWLGAMHADLKALNDNITILREDMEATRENVNPSARLKLVIASVIGGFVGKGALDLVLWLIPRLLGL